MRSSSHCSTSTFGSDHIEDIYFPHALSYVRPWCQSRSKQRHYWARHQTTGNGTISHIYAKEWKYIRIQHQRASERPTDETQHGRGAFLKSGQFLDVDFDHQFIPTEKHDATYSYKKAFGYFPVWRSVGGVIVHVENRDGNTPVKFCQAETLKRLFASPAQTWAVHLPIPCRLRLLFERNRGNHRRAHSNLFYLRASNCESAYTEFAELDGWKTIWNHPEMRGVQPQVQQVHGRERLSPRHSAHRALEHESDLFGDTFSYVYRCILTNDWEMSEKEVIEYYNLRGARERDFDALNNDFGWGHLPCSFLNENTVFLLLMAMCKELLYRYLVRNRKGLQQHQTQTSVEEIHLPLYLCSCQMGEDSKDACAQAIYWQTIRQTKLVLTANSYGFSHRSSLWVGKVYPYMGNSVYNGITKASLASIWCLTHACNNKLVRANGFT